VYNHSDYIVGITTLTKITTELKALRTERRDTVELKRNCYGKTGVRRRGITQTERLR
jgi:hypothetical protein